MDVLQPHPIAYIAAYLNRCVFQALLTLNIANAIKYIFNIFNTLFSMPLYFQYHHYVYRLAFKQSTIVSDSPTALKRLFAYA